MKSVETTQCAGRRRTGPRIGILFMGAAVGWMVFTPWTSGQVGDAGGGPPTEGAPAGPGGIGLSAGGIVPGPAPGQIPAAIGAGGAPMPAAGTPPGQGEAGGTGGSVPGLPSGVTPQMLKAFTGAAELPMTPVPTPGSASGQRETSARIVVSGDPVAAARERGRTIFASRGIGSKAISCATCHDPTELSRVAALYPRFNNQIGDVATLPEAINACLTHWLSAPPYPPGSRDAIALELYVRRP